MARWDDLRRAILAKDIDGTERIWFELLEASLAGNTRRPIALGIDIRTRSFAVDPLLARLDTLEADAAYDTTLLYLDCDEEVLRRRYSETRRRHPPCGSRQRDRAAWRRSR